MTLFCRHKKSISKIIREPRYDKEALIEYSFCPDCNKLLNCRVSLVEKFKYPEKVYRVEVTAKTDVPLKIIKPVVKVEDKKEPVTPGETFVKNNPKKPKRNTGRKPSAPQASDNFSLGSFAKDIYNVNKEAVEQDSKDFPNKNIIQKRVDSSLDDVYGRSEIEDEDDDAVYECVRKESPEESAHRFERAKRRQRKG